MNHDECIVIEWKRLGIISHCLIQWIEWAKVGVGIVVCDEVVVFRYLLPNRDSHLISLFIGLSG